MININHYLTQPSLCQSSAGDTISNVDSQLGYIVLKFVFLCLGSVLFQPGFNKSSLGFGSSLFRYEYICLNRMRSHVIRWERDKLVSTFHRGWIHITVFCWHGIVDNKKETAEIAERHKGTPRSTVQLFLDYMLSLDVAKQVLSKV